MCDPQPKGRRKMQTEPSDPASMIEHYLTSDYANESLMHRKGGTFDLTMIDIEQGALEMTDPGLPEYAFVSCLRNTHGCQANFGDGWKTTKHRFVDIQPSNTACDFQLEPIHIRVVCVPEQSFHAQLDEHGLTPSALEGVMGRFRDLPAAAAMIDAIWRASLSPSPATNLFIDGAYLQLVAQMLMAGGRTTAEASTAAIGDARLARAIDFIETHIAELLTIGALASVAGMSPSHFSRSFKAATGESVWGHVQRRRLERAYDMRTLTSAPVAVIAHHCGFADASHLGRAFKARYGKAVGSL